MSEAISGIVMPKWGLAMQEGMLAAWHVAEGETVEKGQEIADIETSKIANAFESPVGGTLRRRLVDVGDTVPVGALLAVVADAAVADAAIEAFVSDFQAHFDAGETEVAAGPEPAFAEAGGKRIRYLRQGEGEGPPVLLIHGYGGDLNNWLFNQPALAERHTTYALDLPGHGGSTKEVGEGDVATMAQAVLDLMAAEGIGRAHLVGHSMGGAVALSLALDAPDKAASATLVCPAGLGAEIGMAYIDGFIAASRAKKLEPVLQMLVANPDLVTREMIEDILKYKRLDGVDAALKQMRAGMFPGGRQGLVLRERLAAGTSVPIQVIWGRQDQVVPPAHGEGLPAAVKVSPLEGAGHLAHMEKAHEVNALIEELVAAAR